MARYDKYDPKDGGFRAKLANNWTSDDVGKVFAIGLDANGRVVKGAGNTGIRAVVVVNQAMSAGEVVDCMTDGEIVEVEGQAAGTGLFGVAADGSIAGAGETAIGFTVEATRLIVRVAR